MRWLTLSLLGLLIAIQYSLWFGKGGWLRVAEIERQVAAEKASNEKLRARNAALEAEVRDLKSGYEAIEERARSELGMVKQDEVFFQILPDESKRPPLASERASR
jgi:cell division protein FtsB